VLELALTDNTRLRLLEAARGFVKAVAVYAVLAAEWTA
jgi:hypothetical protein